MASAEKRAEALRRQARGAAPDGASGARIDPGGARTPTRPISVHLTPFAPGVGRLPIDDPSRWATFYGKTPAQVVRATLAKIRRAPGEVSVSEENGDVSLAGQVPEAERRHCSGLTDRPVPFATFWDGLSAAQLQAELAALVTAGWRPASIEAAR